jgi:hypothetical protein
MASTQDVLSHMRLPVARSRTLRRVAAAAVLACALAGSSSRALQSIDGYVLHCGQTASGAMLDIAGGDCSSLLVTLGPGSYHAQTTITGCVDVSVALSDSRAAPQRVGVMVGATEQPGPSGSVTGPISDADFALGQQRKLILAGVDSMPQGVECSIDVAITRTGVWTAPNPRPVSLHCTAADTPGGGAATYDPRENTWTTPPVTCPHGVVLAPDDYQTQATLSDCRAGGSWTLTNLSAPPSQGFALVVGQDGPAERSIPFRASLTSLQELRLTLTRPSLPADIRFDNSRCTIDLTITPTSGAVEAQPSPSPPPNNGLPNAAPPPPPDTGPFSWEAPAPSTVEHATVHAGTYRLDTGMAPSPCGWTVEIPGVAGSKLTHTALPGVLGNDGLSNEVVIPRTGEYEVRVSSSCTLPVVLTWVSGSTGPIHTGLAYPNG